MRNLDLGIIPKLERLDLKGCHDLTELYVSVGCLKELVYLNLIGCSRFKSFSFIKQLESLELLSLPKLEVIVESLDEFPRYSRDNLPKLRFTCSYLEEQEQPRNGLKSAFLNLQPCTKLDSVSESICGLQHLRDLTFNGCIPEVPNDLDQLAYLEKLNLLSTDIKCLPNSICSLKHLKSLNLESCGLLEKLPEDLGKLGCLENLILTECMSLEEIPNSICMMNNLKCFHLLFCIQVKKLPEELGLLRCLRELNVKGTGISHLPQSISSLKGLCIFGSVSLLQSCVSATKIQTPETETFCYI